MKNFKKLAIVAAVVLAIGATSVTAFAVTGNPNQANCNRETCTRVRTGTGCGMNGDQCGNGQNTYCRGSGNCLAK